MDTSYWELHRIWRVSFLGVPRYTKESVTERWHDVSELVDGKDAYAKITI